MSDDFINSHRRIFIYKSNYNPSYFLLNLAEDSVTKQSRENHLIFPSPNSLGYH